MQLVSKFSALVGLSRLTVGQSIEYGCLKLLCRKRIPRTLMSSVKNCETVQEIHRGRLVTMVMLWAWCDGCLFLSHGSK